MVDVVGVQFKKAGKIYYFDPDGAVIEKDTKVIVETARGIEFGNTVIGNRQVEEDDIIAPLKKVLRIATDEDMQKMQENKVKQEEAFNLCLKKIREHKLDMKLIDVEYTFDRNKILFYFTADGRVDFRDLVKDLASIFKTRIELRQIGVRDEAKMLGGLGICGKSLCCATFLGEFEPVSIKMAKEQSLSLNPSKISGTCGRLMCCLKYEQDSYEDAIKRIPKTGSIVSTTQGKGIVVDINLLKETVKVKLDNENESTFQIFNVSDIKVIKNINNDKDDSNLDELKHLEED